MVALNDLISFKTLHQSVPLIKTLLFFYTLYMFSIVKGIILIYAITHFYDFIMLKFFKLERISPCDTLFMWNSPEQSYNIFIVLSLEKMDKEGIKNLVIEKGIKKFKKLRSRLTFRLFEWWWQEVAIEEGLKRIEILDKDKLGCSIKSKEDLTNWAYGELSKKFDIKKELPYKFMIIENQENAPEYQNLLLLKFDHSFSDGVAIMNFICGMADNYSTKLFPATMSKSINKIYDIFAYLFFPFYCMKIFYESLFNLKKVNSIFKVEKPVTGAAKIALSQSFNLEEYQKINKQLGITFNDMMVSVMSASAKKYLREHNFKDLEHLLVCFPINMKPVPNNLESIIITNDSAGSAHELKLIDCVTSQSKSISRWLHKLLRNFFYAKTCKIMADRMWLHLPFYLARKIILDTYQKLDITMSNVPGPKEHLIYNGCKVLDMIPLFTPGFIQTFIGVLSYAGSFKITMVHDTSMERDPQEFMKYMTEELELLKRKLLSHGEEARTEGKKEK
jgi:hypothetical protein